ncbi:alpha/beta hydrolase [Rhodococcus tukisamuensis]|uniref:alpha/beta hydrolase n=1 Tax=Rhodococcus tukisamuensis TaxID=168276 RepID=UPI0035315ED9
MPKLELIHRKPVGTPNGPPILLVHGAWVGAWCWEYGFIDKLTELGWEVYALSLRGHGKSEGRTNSAGRASGTTLTTSALS